MDRTTPKRKVRELDCRTNEGIEVRLLWNSLNDSVVVSVDDTCRDESFRFDVAPANALEAFRRPFVYAGSDHDPRPQRTQQLPAFRPRGNDER